MCIATLLDFLNGSAKAKRHPSFALPLLRHALVVNSRRALNRVLARDCLRYPSGLLGLDLLRWLGFLRQLGQFDPGCVVGVVCVPSIVLIIKGNVTWVTQGVASSQNLAYVNSENHVIIKVDNVTNVTFGQMRNSVWIASFLSCDGGCR